MNFIILYSLNLQPAICYWENHFLSPPLLIHTKQTYKNFKLEYKDVLVSYYLSREY